MNTRTTLSSRLFASVFAAVMTLATLAGVDGLATADTPQGVLAQTAPSADRG